MDLTDSIINCIINFDISSVELNILFLCYTKYEIHSPIIQRDIFLFFAY